MTRALRILVAPNAFKESLNATEAAHCISAGIRRGMPNARIVELPIADGGDGTLEVVIKGTGGRICRSQVLDPLGRKRVAAYGITGDGKTAIIEMSRASGLALVPPSPEKSIDHNQLWDWPVDPSRASSQGRGNYPGDWRERYSGRRSRSSSGPRS